MLTRLTRLCALAVIGTGALLSQSAGAATIHSACDSYCEGSSSCPTQIWMQGYCAAQGCSTSTVTCTTDGASCTGSKITCTKPNES